MQPPRWTVVQESEFPWEREALAWLRERLPDAEPFRAWSNFEFIAEDGSINEVDLLVVSLYRIYLVEIKSAPGVVEGDAVTWRWMREGAVYLAPELYTVGALDPAKLDVFSLGALAYHLIAGAPPATTVEELHEKLQRTGGLWLSETVDGILESLELLIAADAQSTMPVIDREPLPVGLASEWARVPVGWIRNVHRGASGCG